MISDYYLLAMSIGSLPFQQTLQSRYAESAIVQHFSDVSMYV